MRLIHALAGLSSLAVAGVPDVFHPGDAARSDQMNANFAYQDSALRTKADTAALNAVKASIPSAAAMNAKADTTWTNGRLHAKADTAALNAVKASIPASVNIGGKADTTWANAKLQGKADTAALNAVKASIPASVNIGGKADTAWTNFRLQGKADTAALNAVKASIPASVNIGGKADTTWANAKLQGKADTAALNAVKASIPASVNIGGKADTTWANAKLQGKVDTAALTTRLGNYATQANLAGYASTGSLANYATTTALTTGLGGKVDTAKLTTRLGNYALLSALNGYATTGSLSSYATTGSLANYATTAAMNGGLDAKMNTADWTSGNQLSAVGGLVGGRGMPNQWSGSYLYLDSNHLAIGAGAQSVGLTFTGLQWGNAYSSWGLSKPDSIKLSESSMYSGYTYFAAAGGNVRFYRNVQIDGSLKVAGQTMTVPDYVFEPEYRLAPLAEVESYTQANKHLPEVPSAKEIQAGGMDLAQMNLVLLRKVEELTLHAIAQEKRIQALEARQAP